MIKRQSTNPVRIARLGAPLLLLGACAGTPPTTQLMDARSAYHMAEATGTAQIAPNQMSEARHALYAAERAHKDDPGSNYEANLGYVAQRKAQIAMASSKTITEQHAERQLDAEYRAVLRQTTADQQAQAQLLVEQPAAEPETTATDALESLKEVASVKQEENGTVITLSSAVLFPTDEDALSRDAHERLDKVASALVQQPEGTQIRVEGHTDATGSPTANEALSQRRADAVRDYLAQRGVSGSMLESIGRGEAHPIASNATEDGRAINRRAEIVVKLPESEQAAPGAPAKNAPSSSSAKSPPPPAP